MKQEQIMEMKEYIKILEQFDQSEYIALRVFYPGIISIKLIEPTPFQIEKYFSLIGTFYRKDEEQK